MAFVEVLMFSAEDMEDMQVVDCGPAKPDWNNRLKAVPPGMGR